ncbi:MAG: GNAT family N-acetyltransferase [Proteobacteria bacterium]|nr:GNAT family N-acetyltransferase [Pseudomonadota bacterium]
MPAEPAARGAFPRWSKTLLDRSRVVVRPLARTDRDAKRAFLAALSSESRRHRFMRSTDGIGGAQLEQLVDIDRKAGIAYAAIVKEDSREKIVAIGRGERDGDGGFVCTLVVADEWQDKGLGTFLLGRLIASARNRGQRRLYLHAYAENVRLNDLVRAFGFRTQAEQDHPQRVIHELSLLRADRDD